MTITVAKVQTVLRNNLRHRPSDIEVSVRYAGVLLDKVGAARLSRAIDVEGVLTITADLIDAMLNDKDPGCVAYTQSVRRYNQKTHWVAGLRRDAKESRRITDPNHHLSAEMFFGGPLSMLSDQHKEKFRRGEVVTYQDVLGVNPEMFFAL